MKETGIYYILNRITGKCYVGSSATNIQKRWLIHKYDLEKGKHDNSRFQNAWNKYGHDNFEFSVLEIIEPKDCISREQFYIDNIKPEYNIDLIAGSRLGSSHSKATRDKISKSHIGKITSPEFRLKISIGHKGIRVSEGARKKISLANSKPVKQINKNGTFKVWKSISEADKNFSAILTKKIGTVGAAISCVCKARQKSAYGFRWEYV